MRTVALAVTLAAFLSCELLAQAQNPLAVGQPIEHEIVPGTSQSYAIELNSGDYVSGTFDQRGIVLSLRVLQPDGSRLRDFPGPTEGKRPFAFIADTAGIYRIELTAPPIVDTTTAATGPGRYELSITEKVSLDDRLKPTASQTPSSPAIEALRAQIARGENTESFWRMVVEKGTPLVERVETDPRYTLVTFLWRGVPTTRNVAVIGTFMRQPLAEIMTRLANTDVWYRTDTIPSGARFVYLISPNSPLIFDGPRTAEQMATLQADPLNRSRWACGPQATRFECQSMVELPGAVPQPWIVRQPNTPEGKVEKYRLKSELLNNERSLSVYTPPAYRADAQPYALLVVFDGDAYVNLVPAPVILDNLIAASKVPAAVAILVGNTNRNKELPPNPEFADFLTKELIPWVHTHYNVTNDPRWTVIGGSSYGAIAAAYAGLRHPEVFGNILCQSGSFMWAPDHVSGPGVDASTEPGWLAKEYIKSSKLPLRFHLDAGLFEVDRFATGGAILESSRHMRDVLLAKGYEVHYQQFVGGHDYLGWRGTFADGLIALIGTK